MSLRVMCKSLLSSFQKSDFNLGVFTGFLYEFRIVSSHILCLEFSTETCLCVRLCAYVYVTLGAEARSCSSFHRSGCLRSSKRSNPVIHHLNCAPPGVVLEYLSSSRCVLNRSISPRLIKRMPACISVWICFRG